MDFEEVEIPANILREAAEASSQLLPAKSKERYEKEYEEFRKWCVEENVIKVVDDVLLVYLSKKGKSMKPSTLWSRFSMIKSCLAIKENVDASKFCKTIAFLKRQTVGYIPKKSKVLTREQVTQFLNEAADVKWLLTKVILVFGIFGACRRDDLIRLTIDDVEDNGRFLVVFLRDGKTHRSRSFTITEEGCSFQPCKLVRKYVALRPKDIASQKFFIAYRNGKCYKQNVGCHTISGTTRQIAEYLNLKNLTEYTGHGLRRSSASMLVEGGADLLTLKRHGGWRSSAVAEGLFNRPNECSTSRDSDVRTISEIVEIGTTSRIPQESSQAYITSAMPILSATENNFSIGQKDKTQGLNISNNQNCTINVHFYGNA
ncbi:uncharacterized protein LOC116166313 [Photinus pyralis]|uniref:uncharacterized protein LOC116166313 n=1 Tax=Photinus pyralis TaxID=7054 RepID=UPI0012677941|nr:uncharacterized protein LOC116166313 [Photinus pyralis]